MQTKEGVLSSSPGDHNKSTTRARAAHSYLSSDKMSDAITCGKNDAEYVEKPGLLPDELPLPDEIAHLSQEEQQAVERTLVRRLDLSIMPVVFILFLLNIL